MDLAHTPSGSQSYSYRDFGPVGDALTRTPGFCIPVVHVGRKTAAGRGSVPPLGKFPFKIKDKLLPCPPGSHVITWLICPFPSFSFIVLQTHAPTSHCLQEVALSAASMSSGASPSFSSQTTYPPRPAPPTRQSPDLRGPPLPTPQKCQLRPLLVYLDQCGLNMVLYCSLIHSWVSIFSPQPVWKPGKDSTRDMPS